MLLKFFLISALAIASIRIVDKSDRVYSASDSQLNTLQSIFSEKLTPTSQDSFTYDGKFEDELFTFLMENDMYEEIESFRILFNMPWSHIQKTALNHDAPHTFMLAFQQTIGDKNRSIASQAISKVLCTNKKAIIQVLSENFDICRNIIVKSLNDLLMPYVFTSAKMDSMMSRIRGPESLEPTFFATQQKERENELKALTQFLRRHNPDKLPGLEICCTPFRYAINEKKFDTFILMANYLPEFFIPYLKKEKFFADLLKDGLVDLVRSVFPAIFKGHVDNDGYLVDVFGCRAQTYIELMFSDTDNSSAVIYEWLATHYGSLKLLDDGFDVERLATHIGLALETAFSRKDYRQASLLHAPQISHAVFAQAFSRSDCYYCQMVLAQPLALEVVSGLTANGQIAADLADKIIENYFYR